MSIRYLLGILLLFSCYKTQNCLDKTSQVLTVIGEDSQKMEVILNDPKSSQVDYCDLTGLDSFSEDINVPLPHRRRTIKGSNFEGILYGNMYVISYKNKSFENFSLPCMSHELYEPVGLEDSVAQIITCKDESTVLTVNYKKGQYKVETRIVSQSDDTSSAAIVAVNEISTAIYISLDFNILHSYPLNMGGIESQFFTVALESCEKWLVSSYSGTQCALFCASSSELYLANGNDENTVRKVSTTFVNPSTLVWFRDRGVAVEVTSNGIRLYWNDFVAMAPITIPSAVQRIDYSIADNSTLYVFLFSNNSVYLLNDSLILSESFSELVNEENSVIANSTYIYNSSPFNSLAYVVIGENLWAVKTVDFVSRKQYLTSYQSSSPVLIDLRVEMMSLSSSMTSSMTTTMLPSTITTVSLTAANSIRSTMPSSSVPDATTTMDPSNAHGFNYALLSLPIFFLIVATFVLVLIFILHRRLRCSVDKSHRNLDCSRQPLPNNLPIQETGSLGVSIEETGKGPESQVNGNERQNRTTITIV